MPNAANGASGCHFREVAEPLGTSGATLMAPDPRYARSYEKPMESTALSNGSGNRYWEESSRHVVDQSSSAQTDVGSVAAQLSGVFSVTGWVPSAVITGKEVFRDTRLNVISPIVFRLVQYSPSSTRPSSCLIVRIAAPS